MVWCIAARSPKPSSRASCSGTKGRLHRAQYRKKGKFEAAMGGTVFLDEIADISLKTQTDCCASCRSARSCAWAARNPSTWISA